MTIISIEGIDGAGKTTIAKRLAAHSGATLVHLPYRPLAIARHQGSPAAQALAYAADMAWTWDNLITPRHKHGHTTILDRGPLSTIAYQGLAIGNQGAFLLAGLATGGTWPDLTVLLDVTPDEATLRQALRGRVEDDYCRLQQLRTAYHERKNLVGTTVVTVDGHGSLVEVEGRVIAAIRASGLRL